MATHTFLLDRTADVQTELKEFENKWIDSVLSSIISSEDIFNNMADDNKIKYLRDKKIEIISYVSTAKTQIRQAGVIIGEWGPPEKKMVLDGDTYCYEVTIKYWPNNGQKREVK